MVQTWRNINVRVVNTDVSLWYILSIEIVYRKCHEEKFALVVRDSYLLDHFVDVVLLPVGFQVLVGQELIETGGSQVA